MMRKQLLAAGLVSCLVLSTAAAQPSKLPEIPPGKAWRGKIKERETYLKPVLKDNSIQYGNKVLSLSPDGKIEFSSKGRVFFSGRLFFHLVENGKANWSWRDKNWRPELSKFRREGRKYIWELWFGNDRIKPFKGAVQELEVLEDGRICVYYRCDLPKKANGLDFRPWFFSLAMGESVWKDATFTASGQTRKLDKDFKQVNSSQGDAETKWIFNESVPSKSFTVSFRKEDTTASFCHRPALRDYLMRFFASGKPDAPRRFFLDLRRGVTTASDDVRGGVDFKVQEDMLLPDISCKNLIGNPSFERGWEGWHDPYIHFDGVEWNQFKDGLKPFKLDDQISYEGRRSLRMNTRVGDGWPYSNPNTGPLQVVLDPGFYTLSFYARGQAGKKQEIVVWIPDFHKVEKKGLRIWRFKVDSESWKRYEFNFEVKPRAPLTYLGFHARFPRGKTTGTVWLDAVQLEKGKKATAYQAPPAEGGLITAAPDNFFSSKDKINGRLRIMTAKPEMSGTVRVRVKNFFGETLLDLRKQFRTGPNRLYELELPLDDLPGLGLFIVQADYLLNDGTRAYDFRRYAKIEYQTDPARKIRKFFGVDFGDPSFNWKFHDILDRWRKLGIGAKHHVCTRKKEVWDTYQKYGIDAYTGFMLNFKKRGTSGDRIKNFFIVDSDEKYLSLTDLNDPRVLIRDHHLDAGGKLTPEYLAKLKQAAKTMAQHYPHIKLWALAGEIKCKIPNDWWGKNCTAQDASRMTAQLLKAFVEGVREGNPKAKVFQECPANMNPRLGIADTDRLLEECNKLGVRFDIIAIHPYRYSPESPDMDADAAELFKVLEKHGYGKTPVFWPEGMHWGPFDIPQWRTKSSSWSGNPVTWDGTLSYDLGWTERKSAAWYARAWLVALKYSDRLFGATSGQTRNNCYMDMMLTPYAAQLIPNTMCSLFNEVKYKKDILPAPYIRAYVFEDAQKRPLVAIWCHKEDVDAGRVDAPVLEADFGDSLETVIDLMNSPRAFTPGKMRFPVTPFPLFFRGKPGTLRKMIDAFERAEVVVGSAISPLVLHAAPVFPDQLGVTARNTVSREFRGTLNSRPVKIPPAGTVTCKLPLKTPVTAAAIAKVDQHVQICSDRGAKYDYDFAFETFAVKRVPDDATVDTLDWNSLPALPLVRKLKPQGRTSAAFRMGWNQFGLFLETVVKDPTFVHVEYQNPIDRWKNDCLQIYIDTFANARQRKFTGYDEDDYDYAVFPNSKGTSAQVFRYQTVESQLGLANQAPPDKTFAPDMPCRFTSKDGVLTYRVFFPAKYLLPMKMQKGWIFGFSLFAPDSNQPQKVDSALSLALDGKGCARRPHTWPMAILTE